MKTALYYILLLIAVSNSIYARQQDSPAGKSGWKIPPIPYKGSDIVYEGNVPIPVGHSTKSVFHNAENWYIFNYQTADTHLFYDNKDSSRLAGTAVIHYKGSNVTDPVKDIFFTVYIDIFPDHYHYRIDSIYAITSKSNEFLYSDMYREEMFPTRVTKPRWTHKYRYEMLSDMDTFIKLAIKNTFPSFVLPE